MRRTPKFLIPLVAVATVAALLLAGCQLGKHKKDKALPVEQTEAAVDSIEEDTMAAYYERILQWDALHGGMRQRESDK